MIYLDHNATTPLDERVLDAMLPFLQKFYGNPSALYRQGRWARSAVDTAREQVAELVGATASQVVFTSGGTEANNLALSALKPGQGLAVSAIEHPSISEPAGQLAKSGHPFHVIPVDQSGIVTDEAITRTIRNAPALASIMLANNETGVIQDIGTISQALSQSGILLHTDAVQAIGKIPVNFAALGAAMMSLSSHKIYGPKGCGALIVIKDDLINPVIQGGGQERGIRAGTENVPAIVGFGKAAELAKAELEQRIASLTNLKESLLRLLSSIPGCHIFAQGAQTLPNTVQFSLPGIDGEMLLMQLDRKGISVSSGSACASGGGQPSPVLTAMGYPAETAKSAIRVSLGKDNNLGHIEELAGLLTAFLTRGN